MLKLLITAVTAKETQSYVKYGIDLAKRKEILAVYDLDEYADEGISIEFDGVNKVVIDKDKERML
jgi:hypothetical protein